MKENETDKVIKQLIRINTVLFVIVILLGILEAL